MPVDAEVVAVSLQNQVPFKGAMQGNDVDTAGPSPGTVVSTTSGTGVATQLGQFSFTQQETANLATFTATGSAHWVAANGDSIDTTIAGKGELTGTPQCLPLHGSTHNYGWHRAIRRGPGVL